MRTDVKTRQDFDNYLRDALAKMKRLAQDEPEDKILYAVQRQLEAIEQWTADGKGMTPGQKDRIVMGLQASREMADFPVEQDLVIALNNYIETLLPTEPGP